ncbi:MAG: hypothetical protein WCO44_11450, partial [Bacteroidota bacterium]
LVSKSYKHAVTPCNNDEQLFTVYRLFRDMCLIIKSSFLTLEGEGDLLPEEAAGYTVFSWSFDKNSCYVHLPGKCRKEMPRNNINQSPPEFHPCQLFELPG